MDPASLVVAEQVVSTTIEGAAVAGIAIAQKTHPLSAAFTRITSENFLPRFDHSISVCNGRAYIFGGHISESDLAGNEIHIISLPLQQLDTRDSPDYKIVPALGNGENGEGDVPRPRAGHVAQIIGDKIYIFGGQDENGTPVEENGKVWYFDTTSLRWTSVDPASGAPYPSARYSHAAAGSEKPLPAPEQPTGTFKSSVQAAVKKIPELVAKPEPVRSPHGTLVVVSGLAKDRKPLKDAWLFDIAAAKWTPLPTLTASLLNVPTIGLIDRRLYIINHPSNLEGEVLLYDLPIKDAAEDQSAEERDVAAPKPQWQNVSFPTNALVPGPEARTGAGLIPITTGHGRNYLLYFFGERSMSPTPTGHDKRLSENSPPYLSTLFTYQPAALPRTAASTKDATRSAINVDSGEHSWAEVRVIPREEIGTESEGKSHPGPRGRFAYTGLGLENKGGGWISAGVGKLLGKTEEDTQNGYGVLVWGGKDARGEVTGDGWILRVR